MKQSNFFRPGFLVIAMLGILNLPFVLNTAHSQNKQFFRQAAIIRTVVPPTDNFGRIVRGDSVVDGGESVAVFDVNRDGLQDAIITPGGEFYFILLTSFDSVQGYRFTLSPPLPVGDINDSLVSRSSSLGLHDFNNDGLLDVYFGNAGRGGTRSRRPRDLANACSSANLITNGLLRSPRFRSHINLSNGTFRYQDIGADGDGLTRNTLFEDFDGDGFFDAYISNAPYFGIWWPGGSAPNQLLPGRPNGLFGVDVLQRSIINDDGSLFRDSLGRSNKDFKGGTVRDFDGDGLPDIISGAYSDIWDNIQTPPFSTQNPAAALLDCDRDGKPDGGYQGDWQRGVMVLQNKSTRGTIRFENVSKTAININLKDGNEADQMHVYVAVPADIDRDGDFDLLVSGVRNFTAHNSERFNTPILRVYRNDSQIGMLKFTDVTVQSGVNFMNNRDYLPRPYTNGIVVQGGLDRNWDSQIDDTVRLVPNLSMAAAIDVDNDGDLDWVLADRQLIDRVPTTNEQFSLFVFLNDGQGRFSLIPPTQHGLTNTARDFSYGDFNRDGRIDIITANGSGGGQVVDNNNIIFVNNIENSNRFIFINILGETTNRLGIGSKVTVYRSGTSEIIGYEEVRTDFAYRSKRNTTLHFGVGSTERVDIRVKSRSGTERLYPNLPTNSTQTLNINNAIATGIFNEQSSAKATQTVNIFPNPSYDSFTIESNKVGEIVLCDVLGNVLLRRTMSLPTEQIDTKGLSTGVYLVRLKTESGTVMNTLQIIR